MKQKHNKLGTIFYLSKIMVNLPYSELRYSCSYFQQNIHILTESVILLFLPLYLPKFRLQSGLVGGGSVKYFSQNGLQGLA